MLEIKQTISARDNVSEVKSCPGTLGILPPGHSVVEQHEKEKVLKETPKQHSSVKSSPRDTHLVDKSVAGRQNDRPAPSRSMSTGTTKKSSASSVARRKQLELEAAEAKARIQMELIDKRLEANLAIVAAEDQSKKSDSGTSVGDQVGGSVIDRATHSHVEEWLERSHQENIQPLPHHPHQDVCDKDSQLPAQPRDNLETSIQQLACTLKDMMHSSSSKHEERLLSRLATPRELPTFSGDCIEWLHFKSAFEESTNICKFGEAENLWRLRKALRGDAKDAVTDLLIGNTPPNVIMNALELRFGRADSIIQCLTSQLKKLQPLPASYQHDLFKFTVKISNLVATMRALNQTDYLRSPELVNTIIAKLPNTLIGKWTDFAYSKVIEGQTKLELLSDFLKKECEMLSVVGIPQSQDQKTYMTGRRPEDRTKSRAVLTTSTISTHTDKNICKFCKKSAHLLPDCKQFKRALRKDKWNYLKSHRLCYCCLIARHPKGVTCPAPSCNIDGCGLAHHALLHWTKPAPADEQQPEDSGSASPQCSFGGDSGSAAPATSSETVANVVADCDVIAPSTDDVTSPSERSSDVLLKVIKVRLQGPNGIVSTYALLDDASSVSMIDSELADELGLKCEQSGSIKFTDAFGLEVFQSEAPKVYTKISGQDSELFDIKFRKISKLNLPAQNLAVLNSVSFNYLSHIKGKVCRERVVPRILIGEDNYFLIAPLEIVHGGKNKPYASRCRLGWSVHGCCGPAHTKAHVSENVCYLSHTCNSDDGKQNVSELSDLITNYFSLDSIGITSARRENTAHLRALQILEETARYLGNQWEVGLPFKSDNFSMPNSYDNALSRQMTLLRKFDKDFDYAQKYAKEVNKLFSEGYARVLPANEIETNLPTWYLPHFGVQNINKPGKLRLVYDAAAKVQGMSLNDYLLTGPDLYNSLLGIMFKFREDKVVIIGDIRDMFLRIKIRPEDQNFLRFLWQSNCNSPLQVCAMQSLIFGATCSPFIAQYIRNKNALKFEDQFPEAVQAILNNHYMDDCLYSTCSEQNAIDLVHNITKIHKHGGFEIRGWSSNSKSVLESIPTDALAHTAVQFKDGAMNTTERTLGLMWHPADDTFGFKISLDRIPSEILNGTVAPTKAQMLSVIMSVYDIHGFLSPFIIKSKMLFQDVHRTGVDWKCHIQPREQSQWLDWVEELKQLTSLRIPRWYNDAGAWTPCYSLEGGGPSQHTQDMHKTVDTQLHIFCDASMKAYAAAAYWRFTRSDGSVNVCLAASKSRVTPLRPISIPRLELQGAVIAARLANTIRCEHKLAKPDKIQYWTDSSTVLQWIRSDPRNYKAFVAHRLGEIDELTSLPEWRYVPSALNVADMATKGDSPALSYANIWFQGPAFLRKQESEWPKDLKSSQSVKEAACEERPVLLTASQAPTIEFSLPDENRFSSWIRLLRATARVLYFIRKCQKKDVHMNVDLMREAEGLLVRKCQHDSFAAELSCLKQGKPLNSDSRLTKLTPYLDDENFLRVGGRIDRTAGVSQSLMRPVIMDGRHKICALLVEHYHRRALHGANELVVNELRQSYWIVRLRPTVRSIAARCIFCRYRRAAPRPQRMADLPAARLQHNRRPFTFAGVDYFGPLDVTVGRKRLKRYGVLFTCLTIRAIHIELTENLTADHTIMALTRMAARRGMPSVLFSDNGTNLRGADVELKRSLEEFNMDKLREDGTARGVEWRFIPPGAPEMGGAWERMIRTVKTSLKVILKERAPQPETLLTLLAEVEALVNSRPITHVSDDPNYPEALTPNHFLVGTSSTGCLYGKYENIDLNLRKQWRVAQRLTDMFWARWTREYLPSLLPRQKWTAEHRSLKEGDYVILVDPNLERGSWRHGVVSAAHAGDDGRVRVVDVRTRTGILRRPVTRVALLAPVDSSADISTEGGEL